MGKFIQFIRRMRGIYSHVRAFRRRPDNSSKSAVDSRGLWRRLRRTRGHVPPTFTNGYGTVSRRIAKKKLTKLYWPSRKLALTKTANCARGVKKVEGYDKMYEHFDRVVDNALRAFSIVFLLFQSEYTLRTRRHHRTLSQRSAGLCDNNFIIRQLYKDT